MTRHQSSGSWDRDCQRHMLAGVKEGIYHPRLPTLRQMEADTASGKLPDEHSRTTTCATKDDFERASFAIVDSPQRRYSSLEATETGREIMRRYGMGTMAPLPPSTSNMEFPSYTKAATDWSHLISSSGEFTLPDRQRSVLGYSGYAVRYLKPRVTQAWRYCLQQNPSLDMYGQRPISVEATNIHRTFGSAYSRLAYLKPWK